MINILIDDKIHLYMMSIINLLILLLNKSQKSQKISIQCSLNDVKTLHDHESCHAKFLFMQQHSL